MGALRFTTKPSAPSAPWTARSTTVRSKLGSPSGGAAMSIPGAREPSTFAMNAVYPHCGPPAQAKIVLAVAPAIARGSSTGRGRPVRLAAVGWPHATAAGDAPLRPVARRTDRHSLRRGALDQRAAGDPLRPRAAG